jgi:hypothetical protein
MKNEREKGTELVKRKNVTDVDNAPSATVMM